MHHSQGIGKRENSGTDNNRDYILQYTCGDIFNSRNYNH